MADDGRQYETKSVRTIRGTEAKAIAKWQNAGWELDTQNQGTLWTEITFRRIKPKMPWRLLAAVGLVLAIVVIVGATQGGDGTSEPNTTAPAATVQSEPLSEDPEEIDPGESKDEESLTVKNEEEPLTVENNKDLATLLASDEDYDLSSAFAAKYPGRTIEFQGNIADIMNHGDYETRYDMLILAGDYSTTSSTGPYFQFRDVNTVDLHLTGSKVPDSVAKGDNLDITARVGDFNPNNGLFFLDPVSTEVR